MVENKSKKKDINIDKIEQMINKFNKKKSLSKPSTDLMNKINQRINNVKTRKVTKSPPKPPPAPKIVKDDTIVVKEIDDLLKKEDEKKKQLIEEMTAEAKLKKDFMDLFNTNKETPPINNQPPVKISTKRKTKIMNDVKNNKNTIDKTVDLSALQKTPKKKQTKKPKKQTQKKNEPVIKKINYVQQLKSQPQYHQEPFRPDFNINMIPDNIRNHITPQIAQTNPYIKRDLELKYQQEQQQRIRQLQMQQERERYLMQKQLFEEKQRRQQLEKQQYEMYKKLRYKSSKFSNRNPKYTFKEPTNTMDVYYRIRKPKIRKSPTIPMIYNNNHNHNMNYNNNHNHNQNMNYNNNHDQSFKEPKTTDMIKTVTLSGPNSFYIQENNGTSQFIMNENHKTFEKKKTKEFKNNLQQNLDKLIEKKRQQNFKTIELTNNNNNMVNNNNNMVNNNNNVVNNNSSDTNIRNLLLSLASKDSIDDIRNEITNLAQHLTNSQKKPLNIIQNKIEAFEKKKKKNRVKKPKPVHKKSFNNPNWEKNLCSEVNNMKYRRSWKNYKISRRNCKSFKRYRISGDIDYNLSKIPDNIDNDKILNEMVKCGIIKVKDRFRNIPVEVYHFMYQLLYQQPIKLKYQY